MYTENDSKVGFWLRWLCSTFFVFTRALCLHNGRSLQTKNLRSRLAKFPTFESFSVSRIKEKMPLYPNILFIIRFS